MHMKSTDIIQHLKEQGHRITRTRSAVVDLLSSADHTLSVPELLRLLKRRGLAVNKTTVYREIDFLNELEVVRPVRLTDTRVSYELAHRDHHHHVVCTGCEQVAEVSDKELEEVVGKIERRIKRGGTFSRVKHHLEFTGICTKCRSQKK